MVHALLAGIILIDLQKAFDTIDLECTVNWFKSYLSER